MKVLIDDVEYLPKIKLREESQDFNILIKEARNSFKETLECAAYNIGMSKSHLRNLENGSSEPKLKTLQIILSYYGIPFEKIK